MKLVAGLGNPGSKYAKTRHNAGFQAVRKVAEKFGFGNPRHKHKALVAKGRIAGQQVLLTQPTTYMNNSGGALKLLVDYYEIAVNDIVVIYDDLDLSVGYFRIKKKGSSGGHKGLQSIINNLGTTEFSRIRIGIDRPPDNFNVKNYVLSHFSEDEKKIMKQVYNKVACALEIVFQEGYQAAMNKFN